MILPRTRGDGKVVRSAGLDRAAAAEQNGSSVSVIVGEQESGKLVQRLIRIGFASCLGALCAGPAAAATFGELASWCAPEDAGGRPRLCANYLQTYLEALRSDNAPLNDGVRACVPESTDQAELVRLIQSYARAHPEAVKRSGIAGAGEALKGRFPCR